MEDSYMVCVRVDELEDPVAGSTTTACVECGDDIWISVESRKQMYAERAMPLCSRCAKNIAQNPEIGSISEGQAAEILDVMVGKAAQNPRFQELLTRKDEVDPFEALKTTATVLGEVAGNPDWGAMAVIVDYDGVVFPPVPIDAMLQSGMPIEILARQILPAIAQAGSAKRVLLGLSGFAIETTAPLSEFEVSKHPDRQETLVLMDLSADGIDQMCVAKIERNEDSKATLGEWMDIESPRSDGLFVDALVPTLQLIRTLQG